MIAKYFFCILIIGTAVAQQIEFTLPPDFSLPPELAGKIDLNQLMGVQNQSASAFQKKCEQNGGPRAFQHATMAFQEFTMCIQSLVDVMKLQQEIESAKPTGQVDEVFKKYCAKTPSFKKCFKDMTEAAKPCFSEKERVNLKTVYNVTEQLVEFICFKEGDRIALFIAEGGQECIQEKQPQLQDCMNNTLGPDYQIDHNTFSPDSLNLPEISFEEKECRQMNELQNCMVGVLETCPTPTTGNIVESLFKFVRKATPCNDVAQPEPKKVPGSATGLTVTSATILLAFASMFF